MKATNQVYVYEITDGAVFDWIAAGSLADANAAYVEMYGQEQLDDVKAAGDGFRVLTEKEMDKLQFRVDGDDEQLIPFAAQLQRMKDEGHKFPTHFACSEY